MKVQAIEKLLGGVLDKFCSTLPDDIANIIRTKSYITGGCIPSMAMGEFVNDYDVYLLDLQSVQVISEYFTKISKEDIIGQPFKVNLITENAINLDNKIQIILKYYGDSNIVIDKFDWAHIKSYYQNGHLTLCDNFYQYIVEKELVYTGSDYPLSSLLRVRKFIKKGWHVSTKTMVNIALDICSKFNNNIQPEDIEDFGKYVYNNEDRGRSNEAQMEELYDAWANDKVSNPDYDDSYRVNIKQLIKQLNGVDPLTIQHELKKRVGENLTIQEIIKLL